MRKQVLWRHGPRNVTWCLGWIFQNYFSEICLIISLWNPLLGSFCVIKKGSLHSLWGVVLAFQPMPQPSLCVNRNPVRYDFRAGSKAIRYIVNIVLVLSPFSQGHPTTSRKRFLSSNGSLANIRNVVLTTLQLLHQCDFPAFEGPKCWFCSNYVFISKANVYRVQFYRYCVLKKNHRIKSHDNLKLFVRQRKLSLTRWINTSNRCEK